MDIRPSPIAGQWYPGDPGQLAESVDAFLDVAATEITPPPGRIIGLIAPHAGHMYSGSVAGYAFQIVRGESFDVVAILCPSHRHAEASLLTTAHEAYATPLGAVVVDQEALSALRLELSTAMQVAPEKTMGAILHDREHAIEIELPFLQRALTPGFKLLPLMLRHQNERQMPLLGEALGRVLRSRRALIVGSSDLSHYYRQERARRMDAEVLREIDAFNPDGVLSVTAEMRGEACGAGAIAATLWAARQLGANRARVVRHATSGDVTGDFERVVGYAAAWIWQE